MKKFFYILISALLLNNSQAQKLNKLGIEIESNIYNFGDIQMWENQPAIFQLKNNSKHTISILPLFSENDLEIIYPDKSIAPGESVNIKAIYYTSGTGSFSRKFPIYFSTSPEAYDLKITGNIKSLSPTAYIQCPQAKPEHSKPKMALAGNVAEIDTEIPLSGSEIKIIALSTKGNTTFYADKNGNFGSKIPTGNYEVIVNHPNYKPHNSFFFLGKNTGYLKIRLEAIEQEMTLTTLSAEKINSKQSSDTLIDKKSIYVKQEPYVQKEKPKELITTTIQTQVVSSPLMTQYTARILDKKTLEPIDEAQLYITAILDKKQTQKIKSDGSGLASFTLKKEDFKIIVNADNYISGEVNIKAGQDDEVIRVFLSPVSDLFEDIYINKKAEYNEEELLSQFSFGQAEFSFDKPKTVITEPTNQETAPSIKAPLNIDSIQQYYGAIQIEKEAMELALQEAKEKLDTQEELLALKEEEIKHKENALSSTTSELETIKTKYNSTEKELEDKIEALSHLEKAKEEEISVAPINYELSKNEYAANNVLFLIDVSSSMGKENKMELLKESIKSMTMILRDIDRVAIIAYNQKTIVILESVKGNNKGLILNAIDSLETSGLTYGVNGLQTAYELLQYYYIGDGNNQIILATDGLFSSANATMTENKLNKEVRQQATNKGIKLSVIGFGQNNEGKKLMQKLANNGQGQFIQIKNHWEAKTVLVEEIKINSKF